ncbi:MAG: helix-turn-helix domain-containing protein [bacterium]|nr:helix-turn-helix domain-containing protein [bacterium]
MPFERSIEHWQALPWLSVKESAAVLGVGDRSVRNLLEEGKLEARRVCGKKMVTVASVQRFAGLARAEAQQDRAEPLSRSELATVRDLRKGVG